MRLVEAHLRGALHLPVFHAADVMPLLGGGDREYAVAAKLLDAGRVFFPAGFEERPGD